MNLILNRLLTFDKDINTWLRFVTIFSIIASLSFLSVSIAQAQDEVDKDVQELTGYIGKRQSLIYNLINLNEGDRLYIYMLGTSGNIDPFLAIAEPDANLSNMADVILPQFEREITAGKDPIIVIKEISDELFLKWDDDSGEGYDAAFEYTVPAEGTFQLIVGGTPTKDTFGNFRLLIGVDSPEVLTGRALPTGDTIAVLNRSVFSENIDIQEVTGTLTQERMERTYILQQVDAEETLYISRRYNR